MSWSKELKTVNQNIMSDSFVFHYFTDKIINAMARLDICKSIKVLQEKEIIHIHREILLSLKTLTFRQERSILTPNQTTKCWTFQNLKRLQTTK